MGNFIVNKVAGDNTSRRLRILETFAKTFHRDISTASVIRELESVFDFRNRIAHSVRGVEITLENLDGDEQTWPLVFEDYSNKRTIVDESEALARMASAYEAQRRLYELFFQIETQASERRFQTMLGTDRNSQDTHTQ